MSEIFKFSALFNAYSKSMQNGLSSEGKRLAQGYLDEVERQGSIDKAQTIAIEYISNVLNSKISNLAAKCQEIAAVKNYLNNNIKKEMVKKLVDSMLLPPQYDENDRLATLFLRTEEKITEEKTLILFVISYLQEHCNNEIIKEVENANQKQNNKFENSWKEMQSTKSENEKFNRQYINPLVSTERAATTQGVPPKRKNNQNDDDDDDDDDKVGNAAVKSSHEQFLHQTIEFVQWVGSNPAVLQSRSQKYSLAHFDSLVNQVEYWNDETKTGLPSNNLKNCLKKAFNNDRLKKMGKVWIFSNDGLSKFECDLWHISDGIGGSNNTTTIFVSDDPEDDNNILLIGIGQHSKSNNNKSQYNVKGWNDKKARVSLQKKGCALDPPIGSYFKNIHK